MNEKILFPSEMKPLLVVCVSKSDSTNKYTNWVIGRTNTPSLNELKFVVLMDDKKITEVHKVEQPGAFTKNVQHGSQPSYNFKESIDSEQTKLYKGKETVKRYFHGNQSFLER